MKVWEGFSICGVGESGAGSDGSLMKRGEF